jgi:hypothetical protein
VTKVAQSYIRHAVLPIHTFRLPPEQVTTLAATPFVQDCTALVPAVQALLALPPAVQFCVALGPAVQSIVPLPLAILPKWIITGGLYLGFGKSSVTLNSSITFLEYISVTATNKLLA